MKISSLDFCVIDTETTGGKADENKIIDIAVVRYRDGIILERFHTLLNPGRPIPSWITMLTGIDDQMVAGAPRFSDIVPELTAILNKGVFTAHNVPFDYGFVRQEYLRLGLELERPRVCTLKMARRLLPFLRSKSLGAVCEHLLIEIYDRHRALGDAEATVYVLKYLLKKLEQEHGVLTSRDLEAYLSVPTTPTSSKAPGPKLSASPN